MKKALLYIGLFLAVLFFWFHAIVIDNGNIPRIIRVKNDSCLPALFYSFELSKLSDFTNRFIPTKATIHKDRKAAIYGYEYNKYGGVDFTSNFYVERKNYHIVSK